MITDMLFHHIGIATGNIEKTASFYLKMGYSISPVVDDTIQHVKICFLSKQNSPLIELVAPLSESSPVSKIINTSGVTPYHTCYEVEDINLAIATLKQNRFLPLSKPVPAIAFENRLICFLYDSDFGLIELLQLK